MTDHANELRRYSRKIGHPAGDVPSVMLAAADEIERLAARLEAAERERDWHAERCEDAMNECAALRSKIEAMERQKPVAWAATDETCSIVEALSFNQSRRFDTPLYALPGAQPEPSEQDASVRKAWARFSHELRRGPDAPYPGMSDAFEQHFSQSFTDREWRAEAATWAAAWKAAKRHGVPPAPSINEGVRKVTLGFRWESEAQHHIPTIEIEFEPVSPDSPNDAKGWKDRDRLASMLSPEAKP